MYKTRKTLLGHKSRILGFYLCDLKDVNVNDFVNINGKCDIFHGTISQPINLYVGPPNLDFQ
jgi:hypothetical protein